MSINVYVLLIRTNIYLNFLGFFQTFSILIFRALAEYLVAVNGFFRNMNLLYYYSFGNSVTKSIGFDLVRKKASTEPIFRTRNSGFVSGVVKVCEIACICVNSTLIRIFFRYFQTDIQ